MYLVAGLSGNGVHMARELLLSKRLGLPGEGDPTPLPSWAQYILNTAQEFAKSETSKTRRVLAFDLPNTGYAAALFSAGFVLEKSITEEVIDKTHHFQNLLKLKPGSRVVAPDSGKYKRYEILAPVTRSDRVERIRLKEITKSKSPLTRYIPIAGCDEVTIATSETKIRGTAYDIQFLMNVIGRKLALKYALNTNVEVLIIGHLNTLRSEIRDTEFCTYQDQSVTGSIQSLVRCSRFPLSVTPFHRSLVDSPSKRLHGRPIFPKTVIFRDSLSFVKSWNSFRTSNWVVFMGNAEARYQEASSILNEISSTGTTTVDLIPNYHPNIEVLSFTETQV